MLLGGLVMLLVFSAWCLMSKSAVSFGEETQNIRNINTVEVLIFDPNVPYFSSTVSVDVSHTAADKG